VAKHSSEIQQEIARKWRWFPFGKFVVQLEKWERQLCR